MAWSSVCLVGTRFWCLSHAFLEGWLRADDSWFLSLRSAWQSRVPRSLAPATFLSQLFPLGGVQALGPREGHRGGQAPVSSEGPWGGLDGPASTSQSHQLLVWVGLAAGGGCGLVCGARVGPRPLPQPQWSAFTSCAGYVCVCVLVCLCVFVPVSLEWVQ